VNSRDYYQILGVEKKADTKQIKEAYRNLALKYHPDRNKDNPASAEKMKAINEAYAVLSDPEKRRHYDSLQQQFGSDAYGQFRQNYTEQDIFRGSDIHKIFEEMTRAFGLRGFEEIFKEFYGSGFQTFEFQKRGFFAKGFIFMGPFGMRDPQRMQLPPKGGLSKLSKYLFKKLGGVELPEKGADINDVIYLDPDVAQQGGPYAYLLREQEKKLVVKIPPNVRQGQKIRLAGLGEAGKNGGDPGDLFLKVVIRKPLLQKMKDFVSHLRK
jgi:DnaJ-class molecular chaperone